MSEAFRYRGELVRVIDGDSMVFNIDLGFHTFKMREKLRLMGIDTHEIHNTKKGSKEHEMGMEEKAFVENWFQEARDKWDGDQPFIVDTHDYDNTGKYGRYLAIVERRADGERLNERLLQEFDDIEY